MLINSYSIDVVELNQQESLTLRKQSHVEEGQRLSQSHTLEGTHALLLVV